MGLPFEQAHPAWLSTCMHISSVKTSQIMPEKKVYTHPPLALKIYRVSFVLIQETGSKTTETNGVLLSTMRTFGLPLLSCTRHFTSLSFTLSLWKVRINAFLHLTKLPLRSPSLPLRSPSGNCHSVLLQLDQFKTSVGKARQKTSTLEV